LQTQVATAPVATAAPAAAERPILTIAATPSAPATTVEWRGAPEFSNPEGWKFKVRGRFQYDVGYVENPQDRLTGAFGFNSRSRRIRLGVEGWFPGDLQYKAEMDFANQGVAYGDVILFWQPKGKVYSFGLGNYDTFQNMEQPSSSRYISFLERSAMIEAFDQNRHVGVWMGLADPKHDSWRFNLGLFGDRIRPDNAINGSSRNSYGNDDWMIATRALYTPKIGQDRLHFGVHYQRRQFQTAELSRNYQTRPFTATIDQRFVSTGSIAAHGDQIYGVEAAAILGSFHTIVEVQQTRVDAIRPGEVLAGRRATTGKRYNGDPTFTGFYGEIGYFLTGERKGYRNGLWDRTKVLHPIGKGGIGAIQLNARYDHLDLDDRLSGTGLAAPDNVAGGVQNGVLFSTIWQPMDYVRFTFQYTHAWVKGGPRAATADPAAAPLQGKFNSDLYLARAQFDF
jgi:phosphate-selective porin OprO/OprP